MNKQQSKSQASKRKILDAALQLFSTKGYNGTSIKDIAQLADISVGRLYHHFPNKLAMFTALLDEYWQILLNPDNKLNQLVNAARFPDDIAELATAIRDIVGERTDYIKLIYVDVLEFRGEHINRFYSRMAEGFRAAYGERFDKLRQQNVLNPEADPLFAVMMTYRFFFHYFLVETAFGVENHFGYSTGAVIDKTCKLVLHGLMQSQEASH
jgi:AcrR family transcriptional regulator